MCIHLLLLCFKMSSKKTLNKFKAHFCTVCCTYAYSSLLKFRVSIFCVCFLTGTARFSISQSGKQNTHRPNQAKKHKTGHWKHLRTEIGLKKHLLVVTVCIMCEQSSSKQWWSRALNNTWQHFSPTFCRHSSAKTRASDSLQGKLK